jgi:hypothetical protein
MSITFLHNTNSSQVRPLSAWKRGLGATATTLGLLLALPAWAADLPDLRPVQLQVPASLTGPPNPSMMVSWTVTNAGPGVASGAWKDALYFSFDDVFDPSDTSFGLSFDEIGPIAPGACYRRTNTVWFPRLVESMTFHLILKTDIERSLNESDPDNNVFVSEPMTFTLDETPSDLSPIAFVGPTEITGSLMPSITLVCGVTNYGPGAASDSWWDAVLFSTDGVNWEVIGGNGGLGPVEAGESYWRTNRVRLPIYESGTYYLMYTVDAGDSLRETDRSNNTSAVLEVNFTHLAPDLAPIAFQVPASVTGSPYPYVTVVWGVTNQGIGPAALPWWYDHVYCSTDAVLDEGDYGAGWAKLNGPLGVGECYWVTNQVKLNAAQSGTYYLILKIAQGGFDLHESDLNNNVLVVPIEVTIFPPDLTPVAFVVPERVTGFPFPSVTVAWSVVNQGGGPANRWMDRVYLSAQPMVNPADGNAIGWNDEIEPLAAGGSYWRTNTFRVPVVRNGTWYLILETEVEGDSDPANNFSAVPVEFEIIPPNLTPVALQAPGVITNVPRATFSVVWGVANQGPGEARAMGHWSDKLYMSRNALLDRSAVVLATNLETGPVPAGGAYWRTNTVTLPPVEPGAYYLIFTANADGPLYGVFPDNIRWSVNLAADVALCESDTNNNQLVVPVDVGRGIVDLKPLVPSVPALITNQTVRLVWGVTNQGTAPAVPNGIWADTWSDNVCLCRSPVQDGTDLWLAENRQAGPLAPGSVIWHTNTVRVWIHTPSPTYYLLFKTDGFNSVLESDEDNNLTAVPVTLDLKPVDLAPIALQVPSVIVGPSNPVVTLAWGVTNQGTGPALDWVDAVYLSTNAVLDTGDVELARSVEAGLVEGGACYWRTNAVRIPVAESGTYYLIFKTDVGESLYESDEDNNVLVVPVTFDVLKPDLAPIALPVPGVIRGPPNPPVTLVWGVTNRGSGPAAGWTGRIYLSTNAVLDGPDVELWRGIEPGPVGPGECFWRTNVLRIPLLASGSRYLIFKLDMGNDTLVAPISFEIQPPDLVPLVLQAPTCLTVLPTPPTLVTLVWGVTNCGTGPAIGYPMFWNSVFLSRHPVLDEDDDDEVDEFPAGPLEAGGSCWHTNTVELDVWPSGTYYLFFKADSSRYIYESNETNNVVTVPVTVNVLFPARFSDEEGEQPEFLPDGSLVLCVYGVLGASYRLEASTNLTDWVRIVDFTCTSSPTGVVDPRAKDHAWRFYRTQSLTNQASGL